MQSTIVLAEATRTGSHWRLPVPVTAVTTRSQIGRRRGRLRAISLVAMVASMPLIRQSSSCRPPGWAGSLGCQPRPGCGLQAPVHISVNEVGLDHYQVRRYDAWYAHITLAMAALAFLAVTRALEAGHDALKGATIPTRTCSSP
jgi:hypothetical protein